MTEIGTGDLIYELRKKIQQIHLDLYDMEKSASQIPELITSTNILRSNEHLSKTNKTQTDLISSYELYCKSLEELLSSVFEIQSDLKDILKEQSSLISSQEKKPRPKTKPPKK